MRGSFRALGERLLLGSFPSMDRAAVRSYLDRAEARLPPAPRGPVVLVVDDEVDLRDIKCRMLDRRGFTTLAAATAAEALQVARHHPGGIDFVVTEVADPAFRNALSGANPGLQVVLISGLPREVAVQDGLITVSDQVMPPPFSADALVAELVARRDR